MRQFVFLDYFSLKKILCKFITYRGFCDPGGIRTHDPQLRRLLLYPAELPDHLYFFRKSVAKVSDFLEINNTSAQIPFNPMIIWQKRSNFAN